MEKIIGGRETTCSFPVRIRHKLLWPCYEFIAIAEGIDNYEKNIIEEVVLRLADIGVTDLKEIAACTGLEEDLVSFMQSRLEQRGCLDSCQRITDTGKERLGEFSVKHRKEIHVYVDAVSGRIVPYYNMLDYDNSFKHSDGKEVGSGEFRFKGFSTAGTETDDWQEAHKLHYSEDYNRIPESDDVTAMLHKLFPKKDGIFARVDKDQSVKRNLRWIMLDIMQPEGSSRDWVLTDGFGHISTFFSCTKISDPDDSRFISSLRNRVQVKTNETEKSLVLPDRKYPKLHDKLVSAQKCITDLESLVVDSPDKEEALLSAMTDSLLLLTQLVEWVLFYILHDKKNEYRAREVLSNFKKFKNNKDSLHVIGEIAAKSARELGFECGAEEKKFLKQGYGKLLHAFNEVPSLFALLDILLIAFEKEPWLKKFAKELPDFLFVLTNLNRGRNKSFHSGSVDGSRKEFTNYIEESYKEILALMKAGLGVEVSKTNILSTAEILAVQNERDEAISRMEEALGFTICHTLDAKFVRFVTDMERRGTEPGSLNNAIILDQYKILENLFVSANEALGDELRNSNWKKKAQSAGFELSETNEFRSIRETNKDRISQALDRKPASMNAACIAFCTLADIRLLKGISASWKSMLKDVSYIAFKRAHGEIPASIDAKRALEMKAHIIWLVKFFAENGFFSGETVN